jgi:hypothetical protein
MRYDSVPKSFVSPLRRNRKTHQRNEKSNDHRLTILRSVFLRKCRTSNCGMSR